MSSRRPLTDDLAACEAKLAALHLPASQIDRDQLMYRAGYAAAEAALSLSRSVSDVAGDAKRYGAKRFGLREAWGWSAVCSTVAAGIAVAVTLQLQPSTQLASTPTDQNVQSMAKVLAEGGQEVQLAKKKVRSAHSPLGVEGWLELPVRGVLTVGGPLLELRRWTLRQPVGVALDSVESQSISSASRETISVSPVKSHRDLLNEFLPERGENNGEAGGMPFWQLLSASPEGGVI